LTLMEQIKIVQLTNPEMIKIRVERLKKMSN